MHRHRSTVTSIIALSIAGLGGSAGCSSDVDPDSSSAEAAQTAVSILTIGATAGASTHSTVVVSHANRTAEGILPTGCHATDTSDGYWAPRRFLPGDAKFAYVELKNPGEAAAAISVWAHARPSHNIGSVRLRAYASSKPPRDRDEAGKCLAISPNYGLDRGALASEQGSAIVVPARGSVFVLVTVSDNEYTTVGTRNEDPTFEVGVYTQQLAPVDKTSIIVPAEGQETRRTVLVSGSQRTSYTLPYLSQCGGSPPRVVQEQNFAYVEVNNPLGVPVTVALTGSRTAPYPLVSPKVWLFAYASPTPPATFAEGNACIKTTSWNFVSLDSLLIPPHQSRYVLVGTEVMTGSFDVGVRTQHVGVP